MIYRIIILCALLSGCTFEAIDKPNENSCISDGLIPKDIIEISFEEAMVKEHKSYSVLIKAPKVWDGKELTEFAIVRESDSGFVLPVRPVEWELKNESMSLYSMFYADDKWLSEGYCVQVSYMERLNGQPFAHSGLKKLSVPNKFGHPD